jgi:hypothetical protein
MKLPKRPVLHFSTLLSTLGLGFVLLSLSGCAGYTFRPNGFNAGTDSFFNGTGGASTFQQQARTTDCESRPIYGAFGEYLRTDTVCR